MTKKLLPAREDRHEEAAAPVVTPKAPAPQRANEPAEKKRTLIGVQVSLETKAQWDAWVQERDTTTTAVFKTFIDLLFHNEFVAHIIETHLPEKDELAELLRKYTPTQRAELAARLRGKGLC